MKGFSITIYVGGILILISLLFLFATINIENAYLENENTIKSEIFNDFKYKSHKIFAYLITHYQISENLKNYLADRTFYLNDNICDVTETDSDNPKKFFNELFSDQYFCKNFVSYLLNNYYSIAGYDDAITDIDSLDEASNNFCGSLRSVEILPDGSAKLILHMNTDIDVKYTYKGDVKVVRLYSKGDEVVIKLDFPIYQMYKFACLVRKRVLKKDKDNITFALGQCSSYRLPIVLKLNLNEKISNEDVKNCIEDGYCNKVSVLNQFPESPSEPTMIFISKDILKYEHNETHYYHHYDIHWLVEAEKNKFKHYENYSLLPSEEDLPINENISCKDVEFVGYLVRDDSKLLIAIPQEQLGDVLSGMLGNHYFYDYYPDNLLYDLKNSGLRINTSTDINLFGNLLGYSSESLDDSINCSNDAYKNCIDKISIYVQKIDKIPTKLYVKSTGIFMFALDMLTFIIGAIPAGITQLISFITGIISFVIQVVFPNASSSYTFFLPFAIYNHYDYGYCYTTKNLDFILDIEYKGKHFYFDINVGKLNYDYLDVNIEDVKKEYENGVEIPFTKINNVLQGIKNMFENNDKKFEDFFDVGDVDNDDLKKIIDDCKLCSNGGKDCFKIVKISNENSVYYDLNYETDNKDNKDLFKAFKSYVVGKCVEKWINDFCSGENQNNDDSLFPRSINPIDKYYRFVSKLRQKLGVDNFESELKEIKKSENENLDKLYENINNLKNKYLKKENFDKNFDLVYSSLNCSLPQNGEENVKEFIKQYFYEKYSQYINYEISKKLYELDKDKISQQNQNNDLAFKIPAKYRDRIIYSEIQKSTFGYLFGAISGTVSHEIRCEDANHTLYWRLMKAVCEVRKKICPSEESNGLWDKIKKIVENYMQQGLSYTLLCKSDIFDYCNEELGKEASKRK